MVKSSSLCSPTTQALLLPGPLCRPPVLLSLPPSLAKDVFLPLTRHPWSRSSTQRRSSPKSTPGPHPEPTLSKGSPYFHCQEGKVWGSWHTQKGSVSAFSHEDVTLTLGSTVFCCLRHSSSFCELF